MDLPRISIVTPSYNQAKYVGWTARSVLMQRYPELEYIVMDGGSTDDTLKVLEPYRDRIAHLVSRKDKGQADAIHKGFARATGDIMAYLNSDDMLAPGTLDFVVRYFAAHPKVDAIYSHRVAVRADNTAHWYWLLPPHSDYLMTRWDLIPQETCFWRRSLFERAGNIDPTFRFAMDYDLFVRYMRAGTFRRVNRFLGAFRVHPEAKTSQHLDTHGVQEIRRVHLTHKIRFRKHDRYVGALYSHAVRIAGAVHIRRRWLMPGALRGFNYDYDTVWGGQLNDARLPPLPDAPAASARVDGATKPAPVLT